MCETSKQTTSKPIHMLRTEGEWQFLAKRVQDLGYPDLHSYLRREISRLRNNYEACEDCVCKSTGDLKRFRHHIPADIYAALAPLAEKMHKPMATILDEMLLTPLLSPQKGAVR